MNKKQKRALRRIFVSAFLFAGAFVFRAFAPNLPFYIYLLAFLPAYLASGADVLASAFLGLFRGRLFDECFLMSVATVGALVIGEYPEAVFVMLFYRVGELFESLATHRARRALSSLASLVPDTARLVNADGAVTLTDAEEVAVGSYIRVLPGDRVPLDGVVTEGVSSFDLSSLTGEALPTDAAVGTSLPAGAVCLDGAVTLRTVRPMEASTAARILSMVENATDRKAKSESFITRFARVYTPIVCALALAFACISPFFGMELQAGVYIALSFLVISCPCALVISVPLAFFSGVGCGAARGVLFKGSRELERLASVEGAAFDKTGTLTHGVFRPTAFLPAAGVTKEALFSLVAALESASTHPIARSVTAAYGEAYTEASVRSVTEVRQTAGGGVCGLVDGESVAVGNAAYLASMGVTAPALDTDDCVLYAAREGKYLGAILVSDVEREDAREALAALRRMGLSPLYLLSGDRKTRVEKTSLSLGLDGAFAACLPADKARALEEAKEKTGKRFLFVGDGINDAPALASADCGMAMGALGTDAAQVASDVVLLSDGIDGAVTALAIARKTVRIVRGNIVFILGVKAAVMLLSACSLVGMWAAVFADVGVSVVAVLNAVRAGKCKRQAKK